MRIGYIEEFIICAKHLNIRQAANELHMAQSNLSKHMKQLENELGCTLFTYSSNKMSLTQAGGHFLTGAQSLLTAYTTMRETCNRIEGNETENEYALRLVAQQHSLIDLGVESYYRFVNSVKKQFPNLQVYYAKSSRRHFIDELKGSKIDLCLDYRSGNIASITADYASKGIISKHLCSERLAIWCPLDHPLSRQDVQVSDLKGVPIVMPCDASAPTKKAVTELCARHGFNALFFAVPTTNQAEFISARIRNAVFVYPISFTETHLLKGHDDMVAVPLQDDDAFLESFAITYPTDNPFSDCLIHFITQK